MTIKDIFLSGTGIVVILLTLVQISPVKIDPWGVLVRWLGKMLHGDIIKKLDYLENRLDEHIRVDDERSTDWHRVRILQFNTELLHNQKQTKETFNEIMYNIDTYERYCLDHPAYQNNRAVLAIENIKRVYMEKLENNDFL